MKLSERVTDKVPIVRKRQMEQAQAKEEALINSLSDGIIVRDQKLKISKINPALTEMLGYTEEDLVGKYLRDVIPVKHLNGQRIKVDEITANTSMKSGKTVS